MHVYMYLNFMSTFCFQVFTILPPLALGLFDQNKIAQVRMADASLYKETQSKKTFSSKVWKCIALTNQCLVLFLSSDLLRPQKVIFLFPVLQSAWKWPGNQAFYFIYIFGQKRAKTQLRVETQNNTKTADDGYKAHTNQKQ